MAQESLIRNPFMLMMHPEVVLAAVEKSERLSQLNRHLCRPLDRPAPAQGASKGDLSGDEGCDGDELGEG